MNLQEIAKHSRSEDTRGRWTSRKSQNTLEVRTYQITRTFTHAHMDVWLLVWTWSDAWFFYVCRPIAKRTKTELESHVKSSGMLMGSCGVTADFPCGPWLADPSKEPWHTEGFVVVEKWMVNDLKRYYTNRKTSVNPTDRNKWTTVNFVLVVSSRSTVNSLGNTTCGTEKKLGCSYGSVCKEGINGTGSTTEEDFTDEIPHKGTHTDVIVTQAGLVNTRWMMTSWFRKYTFNENLKRGERERGERIEEREREREGVWVGGEREREKVNIYTLEENREKGEGERHGMRHDSGIQKTPNVFWIITWSGTMKSSVSKATSKWICTYYKKSHFYISKANIYILKKALTSKATSNQEDQDNNKILL